MKNIIVWELRQRRNMIIWWNVAIVALIVLILLLYPSIQRQAAQLNEALNQLPASLRELRTGGSSVDITSAAGFLNSQLFYVTLPMLYIILAISLGGSLLAREEQNRTLELLLARPISRGRLLFAKATSGLIIMATTLFSSLLALLILTPLVELQINKWWLVKTVVATLLFCAAFGVVALTLSATSFTRKLSTAFAVFFSFGGYLLTSLSSLSDLIEMPSKLFPYHYFRPIEILQGSMPIGFVLYTTFIFLIGSFISWAGFRKRDIT